MNSLKQIVVDVSKNRRRTITCIQRKAKNSGGTKNCLVKIDLLTVQEMYTVA